MPTVGGGVAAQPLIAAAFGPDHAGDWERVTASLGADVRTLVATPRVRFAASPALGLEPVRNGWCWGRHIQRTRAPADPRDAAHELDLAGFWWDGSAGVMHTGLFGVQELYVRTLGATTFVCNRISPLASIGPALDIDWDAWAMFITVNHHSGEDTGFAQIRRLTFANRLEFTATSAAATTRDVPAWLLEPPSPTGVDDIWRAVRGAVRPRFGEEVDITLSGGLDSRLILAALSRRRRVRIAAWTTHGSAGDFEMADALALGRTTSHVHVDSTVADWRENFLPTCRRLEHGTSAHAWLEPLADALRSRPSVLYDGFGGDVFLRRFPPEPGRGVAGSVWHLMTGGRWEREDKFLSPTFRRQHGEHLREKWTARGDLWSGHPSEGMLRRFATRHNHGVALSPFRLFAAARRVITPLADPGVFRAALGLPASSDKLLDYRDMVLERYAPDLYALPATGRPRTPRVAFQDPITTPDALAHLIEIIERERATVEPLDPGLRALMAEPNYPMLKWQARLLASAAVLSDWLTMWRPRLNGADRPWT